MQLSAKLIGYFPAAFTPQEQTEFTGSPTLAGLQSKLDKNLQLLS